MSKRRGLDYFMLHFPLFISILIISTLILTQINVYDLFVILLLFAVIAIIRLLDFDIRKPIKEQLKKTHKRFILYIVKSFEHGDRLLGKKNLKKTSKNNISKNNIGFYTSKKNYYQQIIIVTLLGLLAFGSRYYFFSFDTYLLSDIWYSDLTNFKDISKKQWFFHQGTMMGLFSVVNFYNEITGITDAVALTSFGFIESVLVTISVFWSVNKLTNSKITPGLIAALSYIFLYPLVPINIELITQPKSITFGFTLVLPVIVYSFNPKSLTLNSKPFFIIMFMLMFSIMHIDLFLIIYIIPIVLTIAILFNYKSHKILMKKLISAYVLVIGVSTLILFIVSKVQDTDLLIYINSNIYSYKNYTYASQLILPLKKLLDLYLIITLVLILISIYLWTINKKYKLILMVSLLLGCFFLLSKFHVSFIDNDLLNQVLSIIIPIFIGISSYLLYALFSSHLIKFKLPIYTKVLTSFIIIVSISLKIDTSHLIEKSKKVSINGEIIKVYDKMNHDLLPFSYGVVHNYINAQLGDNRHFFLNYSYFAKDYILKDKIFNDHIGDLSYFKKNPEDILPQSIFVFIYDDKVVLDAKNNLILEEQKAALISINLLKTKGRDIQVYYKTPTLTVYEIINQPKSSKITDLLL